METTHVVKVDVNKNLLCQLLELSDLDYETMLMDGGEEYLERLLCNDAHGISQLKYNKFFWMWWKNQWQRRNRIFLAELAKYNLDKVDYILQPDVVRILKDLYKEKHNVSSLHIYPSRVIMELIYAEKI